MFSRPTREERLERRRRKSVEYAQDPFYKRVLKWIEARGRGGLLNLVHLVQGTRPVSLPIDFDRIQSILFIRNDAIGDTVVSAPIWQTVRRRYPHLRIGVVASFLNRSLIERDPAVDRVYDGTLDFSPAGRTQLLTTRRALRMQSWDIVLPLIYGKKTKISVFTHWLVPRAPLVTLLVPGETIERYGKLFDGTAISRLPDDAPMSLLLREHLALTAGIEITDEEWKGKLYPAEASLERIDKALDEILSADRTSRIVHINLSAQMAAREFGIERSVELARLILAANPDCSVVMTSIRLHRDQALRVLADAAISRAHIVATDTIDDVIAIVRHASLVITPDTSVMHIAAAEAKPIIGFYTIRNEWVPVGVPAVLFVVHKGNQVSTIPIEEVATAASELLRGMYTTASWRVRDSMH